MLAVLRALAGAPIIVALAFDQRAAALAIFILAALSDALDGWLARRSGTLTEHGVLLDPLADKALVLSTLAALVAVGALPPGLGAAIAVRELLVSGLRVLRHRAGLHLPASSTAKLKTAFEMCGIAVLIAVRPPAPEATLAAVLLAAALALGIVTLPAYLPRKGHRDTPEDAVAGGR
jgi:CDP-diacylglycerol--glycerol-3-phosphate 3-phosphatidyltransferase